MKRLTLLLLPAFLLFSCSSGKDAAKEVCECYKKANAMDASDPKRTEAQNDCIQKQGEAWNKLRDDPKKADEFNKTISECATELIKSSFGK